MQARTGRFLTLIVLLACFALAGAMHWQRGALSSGFGGADDEAAHMVSGVMVHDYLVDPDPLHPVRYAERYYVHYPKVAIGQWPPGYYAIQALWMMLFGVARESIVLLSACLMAATATLIFRALSKDLGLLPALASAALFLLIPSVQSFGAMAMTELPLALFCLAAVLAFGRLLDKGQVRDGILFGVCAGAAILTKGNALALALVPPLAILFSRRFDMLRSKPMWLSALIVALLGGPWTLYFLSLNRSTWGGGQEVSARFTLEAAGFYASAMIGLAGALVFVLALWGAWRKLSTPSVSGQWVANAAWCVGLLLFHELIPSSIEVRHLILLVPSLCLFAAAGAVDLAARIPAFAKHTRATAAALLLLSFFALGWGFPQKRWNGYDEAVAFINAQEEFSGLAVLVDSGAVGEGLAVSEFVLADRARPNRYVVRATKYLSRSTWIGDNYHAFYPTPEATAEALAQLPIGLVLFDHSIRPHQAMEHHFTLERMLKTSESWELVRSFDVQRDDLHFPAGLELWKQTGPAVRPPIYLDFAQILGRDVPLCTK